MEFIDNLPSMDLLRSEKMTFVQLIIPVESAHRAVSYLAELGLLQFKDLNTDKSPFQRTFVNQVKRCGEMSRKIRFFKDQISKAGVSSPSRPSLQPDIELEELDVCFLLMACWFLCASSNIGSCLREVLPFMADSSIS